MKTTTVKKKNTVKPKSISIIGGRMDQALQAQVAAKKKAIETQQKAKLEKK